MDSRDVANDILNLCEGPTMIDFYRTLGGNKKAGQGDLALGMKYAERITLLRSIDVERTQIKSLIEATSKLSPEGQTISRALQNALKSFNIAYEELNKKINSFNHIDIHGKVTNSKK